MKRFLGWTMAVAVIAGTAAAQSARIVTPRVAVRSTDESNSARIGVYLGENGMRDTLGVLVNSLVADGPAAKAGLKDGDRIQAIGTVNLKMTRDDAGDPALSGMMSRRLTRELDKLKAGDEVELRVLSGAAPRTIRVKTVTARDLETSLPRQAMTMNARMDDRAALGLSMGGSISKRDTLGVFVVGVTPDGPAEKAGIIEGDRIARINGMDLRVPSEDAGDAELARARMRRFTQEVNKLKAGDAVTLSVTSGGRQREVRLTAVKSSELHGNDGVGFFFGDGAFSFPSMELPRFQVMPRGGGVLDLQGLPNIRTFKLRSDSGETPTVIREQIQRAMEQARKSLDDARIKLRTAAVRRIS
jgi:serine protease Do